jgi:single-stranded DNA-specific DHH superfamily exonuclease
VGTLADKVPLLGFNRTLCRQAVDGLFEHADETLKQLMQALYISCESSARIAFLHQVGRLFSGGHAADGDNLSLRLMLAPQVEKGAFLRALLAEKARYDEQAGMVVNFLMENPPAPDDACFLLHDENDDIPYNLCSLAAAFITGNYKIPALVLKRRQGDLVCEARSTDGFNLVEAFFACRETMADYGGMPAPPDARCYRGSCRASANCLTNGWKSTASRYLPIAASASTPRCSPATSMPTCCAASAGSCRSVRVIPSRCF